MFFLLLTISLTDLPSSRTKLFCVTFQKQIHHNLIHKMQCIFELGMTKECLSGDTSCKPFDNFNVKTIVSFSAPKSNGVTYVQTSCPLRYLHSPLLLQCCGEHCSQNLPARCLLSYQRSLNPSAHSHTKPPKTFVHLACEWQSCRSGDEHSSKSKNKRLH